MPFKTLRTLSLVGLVLSCSLWALGYTRINCFADTFEFDLTDGAISFAHVPAGDEQFDTVWSWSGFRTEHLRHLSLRPIFRLHGWPNGFWEVRIPLWLPAMILALVLSRPIRTGRRLRKSATDGLIHGLLVFVRKVATIACTFGLVISVCLWVLSRWGIAWCPPSGPPFISVERGAILQSWWEVDRYHPSLGNVLVFSSGRVTRSSGSGLTIGRFSTVRVQWLPSVRAYDSGPMRMIDVTMPLWIPVLLFAVAPCGAMLPAYRRHKRRRRAKLGLCLCYGYDLRGSINRCPECGEPFRSLGVGELRNTE